MMKKKIDFTNKASAEYKNYQADYHKERKKLIAVMVTAVRENDHHTYAMYIDKCSEKLLKTIRRKALGKSYKKNIPDSSKASVAAVSLSYLNEPFVMVGQRRMDLPGRNMTVLLSGKQTPEIFIQKLQEHDNYSIRKAMNSRL